MKKIYAKKRRYYLPGDPLKRDASPDSWLVEEYEQDVLFEDLQEAVGKIAMKIMEPDELPDPVECGYEVADHWVEEEEDQ